MVGLSGMPAAALARELKLAYAALTVVVNPASGRGSSVESVSLEDIGRGIEEEPEFDVAPDPRTPPIRENPVRTLEIVEARSLPSDAGLSVDLRGYHYAVGPQTGYHWNRKAFSLLYQLFQMSVSTVAKTGPAITIAK